MAPCQHGVMSCQVVIFMVRLTYTPRRKRNLWRKEEKNIIKVKTSGVLTRCNVVG